MGKRKTEYQLIILSDYAGSTVVGGQAEISTGFFYPTRITAIQGAKRHRARHPTLRQLAIIKMKPHGENVYLHKGIVWKETPKTLLTKKQARFPNIGDLLRS